MSFSFQDVGVEKRNHLLGVRGKGSIGPQWYSEQPALPAKRERKQPRKEDGN